MARSWKTGIGIAAALAGTFIAVVGLAHTPQGRPLLRALGRSAPAAASAAGCPLGYDGKGSVEQQEAQRQRTVAQFRGETAAPSRPALGFTLGATTRDEVSAWVTARGVRCREQGPARLTCEDVGAAQLPGPSGQLALREMYLSFDPAGRLVSLGTVRSAPDAAAAAHDQVSLVADLRQRLGDAGHESGEATGAFLQQGLLRQARAEFRFRDYYATSSATTMASDRFVVSERYELLGGS